MPKHHAILYCGSTFSECVAGSDSLASQYEIEFCRTPVLSIGQARLLIQSAYTKPFEKPEKLLVIEAGQIAIEAQHALLKVLEEPPMSTKFVFILTSVAGLLPTLLSRLHHPKNVRQHAQNISGCFAQFLADSYQDRLAFIATITKTKDTTQLEDLAAGLAVWLTDKGSRKIATELLACLIFLPQRGASKKMLWEHIALTLSVEPVAI